MLKKLLLVAVIAGVAGLAIKGTRFLGYAKHEVSAISEWADDQVPVEKKIAAMRKDVANLSDEVEKVKDNLAKEIVEVRELTNIVAERKAVVEKEHTTLVGRGESLKDVTEKVSVGRLIVPVAEAKEMLRKDVNLHLDRKKQLANLEQALAHHERIRDTLEKQLNGMIDQKRDLKTQIDAVEADYKAIQLAQIESKYQRDDSKLSQVKENLHNLRKKLDVEREKLKLSPRGIEEAAPVSQTTQSVDDILAPLTAKPAETAPTITKSVE